VQSVFGILKIPEWIVRFAYTNMLWILFTLMGGIILGIFPATTAMFAVVRRWLLGETDIPVFKTFWGFYREDFLKSNLLGLILTMIGLALYIDYQLLYQVGNDALRWLHYLFLTITSLFLLTLLYTFPVFVHYQLKVLQVLKTSFFIMAVSPLSTIMMIAGSILIYFSLVSFPGFVPIFSASLLSFLIMWAAHLSFLKIDRKKMLNKNRKVS
jgi:uncharacterized membrane protein YesL